MHRIIGGEFAINSRLLSKNEKSIELQYSSGRSVLYSILMHIKGENKKILLPAYLCDSITRTVIEAGWKYELYQIDKFLYPIIDEFLCSIIDEFDSILLINYFGMIDLKKDITKIRKENTDIYIIEDNVQAFYAMNESLADFSFTSLRKWFPCPDGALLHANDYTKIEPCIKTDNDWAQYKLAGNILKNYCDYLDDDIALALLNKGEELLDNKYLSPCSEATKTIFTSLDLNEIAEKRKKNAKILHEELLNLNIPHLYSEVSVPLFIPIFVENRDELRKAFFSEKIFTPKHWPRISDEINGKNSLYDTELSLICDQRYGAEDMLKQISVLKKFLKIG